MYTYVKSCCLTINSHWEDHNLEDMDLAIILKTYRSVFLVLSVKGVSENVLINLLDSTELLSGFMGSLKSWLNSLGNKSLKTVNQLPVTNQRMVKYANAIQAGYHLEKSSGGLYYNSNADNADIRITRFNFNTDLTLLNTYCLLTVNGFVHDAIASKKEAFILEGAKTARMGNDNHVGILSFFDVGELKKIKLSNAAIEPFEPNTQLKNKIRITLKNSIENKSFFLVLGGYLVLPDSESFFQVALDSFVLDLNKLPYLERLMESKKQIDLGQLGVFDETTNLHVLTENSFIKKYLNISQSFFVVVDTPNLNFEKISIKRSPFPGQFIATEDPVYPIIGGHGKIFEFWKQQELNRWVVNTKDSYYRRYILTETNLKNSSEITDSLDSSRNYEFSEAHLLKITSF